MIRLLRRGEHGALVWGFLDQTLSSVTNFGLSLLAGRMLGPSGLGHVFLGFSAYLVAMGLLRGLLIEPLIAVSAATSEENRRATASQTVTLSIALGVMASIGLGFVGWIFPGPAGRAFLLFSPWIVPGLLQQTWRGLLFRDRRAAAAAANDGVWFVVMAIAVPFAVSAGTDWALVAAWGAGATAGAIMGFFQTRIRPHRLLGALAWWRQDALPFGKWNVGTVVVSNLGTNALTFVVAGILGANALGGFRATQTIFAPLTLILPALAMPGLPAISRSLQHGFHEARSLAMELSGIAVAAALGYVAVLLLGGWRLLPALFGDEFARYQDLIWPTAAWQVSTAAAIGFVLLLKAGQRGPTLLLSRAVGTCVTIAFVAMLAWRKGLVGATWGGACGAFASLLILIWTSTKVPSARPARPELQPSPHDLPT
jgi:O-antigen/teichoic acid export membrane protein